MDDGEEDQERTVKDHSDWNWKLTSMVTSCIGLPTAEEGSWDREPCGESTVEYPPTLRPIGGQRSNLHESTGKGHCSDATDFVLRVGRTIKTKSDVEEEGEEDWEEEVERRRDPVRSRRTRYADCSSRFGYTCPDKTSCPLSRSFQRDAWRF